MSSCCSSPWRPTSTAGSSGSTDTSTTTSPAGARASGWPSNSRECHRRLASPGSALAVNALAAVGRPAIVLELGHLAASEDPASVARIAARDARLRGAGLIAGPIEALSERGLLAVRAFAELDLPVILIGKR